MPNQIKRKEQRNGVLTEVTYEEVTTVALTKEQQIIDILAEAGVEPENQSNAKLAILNLYKQVCQSRLAWRV